MSNSSSNSKGIIIDGRGGGGGGGMSNHDIEALLRPLCSNFQGVFSADTIPPCLLQPSPPPSQQQQRPHFSIVCNLSEVDEPGTHFVTILSFANFVLYLDSLGLPCTTPPIAAFLRQLNKPVFSNRLQIQDATRSNYCGLYCILFILHFSHRCSSDARFFWWKEKHELFRNDAMCLKCIRKILNKMDRKFYFFLQHMGMMG